MKILVLSNLYPPDVIGGYELGCRQAVDSLRALGHEVRVLTTAPRVPVAPQSHVRRTMRLVDAWSDYHFKSNAVVTNLLEQGESLRVNAFNIHALLAELDDFRPDVVYVWMLVGVGGLGLTAAGLPPTAYYFAPSRCSRSACGRFAPVRVGVPGHGTQEAPARGQTRRMGGRTGE